VSGCFGLCPSNRYAHSGDNGRNPCLCRANRRGHGPLASAALAIGLKRAPARGRASPADCHKLDTPAVAAIYRLGSALPPWLGEVRADRGGIAPWRARSRARSNQVRHSLGGVTGQASLGRRAPVPQAHVTWRGSRGIGRSLALGLSALTAPWHATSQLRWAEGRGAGLWRGRHAGPCDHRPRVPPQITASDHRLRSPPQITASDHRLTGARALCGPAGEAADLHQAQTCG
jgi:hypothetical protein